MGCVDVTLVRHALLDENEDILSAESPTDFAVQHCHALGEILQSAGVSQIVCSSNVWSLRTVAAATARAELLSRIPTSSTDLLDEHVLEHGTPYDAPEWGGRAGALPPESLDSLKARVATAVKLFVLPHVLGEASVHIVFVSGAIVLNELLQHLFMVNSTSVAAPGQPVRQMHMYTMPLVPASFHRVEVTVDHGTFAVRLLTLGETAHLQDTAPVSPLLLSPDELRASPVIPSQSLSPEAIPRSESRYMSALRIFSPSPHLRPRTDNSGSSLLHSRYGRTSQGDSSSSTPVHGGARSIAQYDAAAIVRSFARFDTPLRDPDTSDVQESQSISTTRSIATPRLNKWPGEAINAASSSFVSLSASVSRASLSSSTPQPIVQLPPQHSSSGGGTLHNVSTFAQNLFGYAPTPTPEDAGVRGDALWNSVCIRILSVFNGELDGSVEEVNETLVKYIVLLFERDPTGALGALEDGLRRVVDIGLVSITVRLQGFEGNEFLWRLVDLWSFYFGTVVPYVHAYVHPIQTTALHLARVNTPVTPVVTPTHRHNDSSGSDSDSEEGHYKVPLPRLRPVYQMPSQIDVRTLLLEAFRDHVVLPIHEWLRIAVRRMHEQSTAPLFQLRAHLAQLMNVLSGVVANDEARDAMEQLRDALQSQAEYVSHQPVAVAAR